jgi:hypothetical protein
MAVKDWIESSRGPILRCTVIVNGNKDWIESSRELI